MQETLEKQTKTGEIHNYPFDAEIFRRTFNGYARKYETFLMILWLVVSSPFIAYGIAWYLDQAKVDITGFLNVWHALGLSNISYELISSGMISFGNLSCGVISIGVWGSCGVISIGCWGSCGIISIGLWGSCGVISISPGFSAGIISLSSTYTCGLIAIAPGMKKPFVADEYLHGKAWGVIASGRQARGVYALSYDEKSEGTYQFSPKRQDPEAVVLFTQWFRKFKDTFVLSS
ncbi:hypothetical protein F4Y59_06925 [Candidatus Poribacteria bacterium]|nr:hypothetical protein [Candidatus Poribacteria bacterium]MYK18251.1 hypothetical protein [Candidatus Poribacteria bacterium]